MRKHINKRSKIKKTEEEVRTKEMPNKNWSNCLNIINSGLFCILFQILCFFLSILWTILIMKCVTQRIN